MNITSVILAAGRGTRMNSDLPKVLHPLGGRPMIHYAVETTGKVTGRRPVLVIGYGADQVRAAVGDAALYAFQREQKGTGHAVLTTEPILRGRTDAVMVTFGDMPLLTAASLRRLSDEHRRGGAVITMLTVMAQNPRGFGRIVRAEDGSVAAIVEEAVATPEQLAIRELNVGAYVIDEPWLWNALRRITLSPKGEYYLTNLVEIARDDGHQVRALTLDHEIEAIGINTPAHLAEAEAHLLKRAGSFPAAQVSKED